MADYRTSLAHAWRQTSKNKSLLLVYIIQVVVTLLLFAIIFIPEMPYILASLDTATGMPAIANKTLLLFMLFSIIDIAIMLVFNAWYKAGIIGMLNAAVEDKKPTAKVFFQSANNLWKAFLAYQIVRFVLVFLTALPLTILAYLYVISKDGSLILPLFFALLLFLVGWFLLSASLFFAIPAVVRKRMNAMNAITQSFGIFKKQRPYVMKSFLIYLALMTSTVLLSLATVPLTTWLESTADNSWRYLIVAAEFIVTTIITIVAAIFMLDTYRKH